MLTSMVDWPGAVGSPLTTARSAPGGSKGGTIHCSFAESAVAWAMAPATGAQRSRTASAAIRVGMRLMVGLLFSLEAARISPLWLTMRARLHFNMLKHVAS